ncbi:ABC transporter permease/substrate-binding protein [Aneurinibacillus sp. REN35]|uniref:ABC transporter permease/substrate-binding protein n=1 Tax=Aneurinibacillus sp. REN35 TaxID=3237286 RepID=UPI0035271DE0
MQNFFDLLAKNQDILLTTIWRHLQLSVVSLLFAVIIALPLGIYLTRKKRIAEPIIGVTAVLQTIPSLALLGFMIPLIGIGPTPAIIALTAYALLPILRNTYTGISGVDPALIEAATGMGMNSRRRLTKVELPLAMPTIMAGIRTAMVLIVGTATLAALIGAGGLGDLILTGIQRADNGYILLGAIPAALLAILFDVLLRFTEKRSMSSSFKPIIGVMVVFVLLIASPFIMQGGRADIVLGAKLGSEPNILINMYKILIEEQTDLTVELKPNLGGTDFLYSAIKKGDIDAYPEYTGTAVVTLMKQKPVSNNPEAVYKQAQELLAKQNLTYLEPMKFSNTYALAVKEDFAKRLNLQSISDLKNHTDKLKAGFTFEFKDREDGYKGIQKVYGLTLPTIQTMDAGLRAKAIGSGDVNIIDAYSTDGYMIEYKLKALKDDKKLFPPYNGAPLIRNETLERHPELKQILNTLAGMITEEEMMEMNYRVDYKDEDAAKIAQEFLEKKGLLKK